MPEIFLDQLAAEGTDYHIVELTSETSVMADRLSSCYENAAHAMFTRTKLGNRPDQFLPMVINSICSSISNSSAFGGPSKAVGKMPEALAASGRSNLGAKPRRKNVLRGDD